MSKAWITKDNFVGLANVSGVEQSAKGALFRVGEELFRVDVLRNDVVRFKISQAGKFDEEPTYAVCQRAFSPVTFTLTDEGERFVLSTPALRVVVQKAPFAFHAYRSDGSAIFESADGKNGPEAYLYLNDTFVVTRKRGVHDSFYGLGEKTGPLNRRGQKYVMWNYDIATSDGLALSRLTMVENSDFISPKFDPYYMTIPFYYHAVTDRAGTRFAGMFVDNGYLAKFDYTDKDHYSYEFQGGQYTEYVFAGPGMESILEAYTWLTGRMQLPPLWSLGYHQCRWFDYHQPDVLRLADEYRERKLPCDVLWLDIHYMDGYRVFTWDKEKFPAPHQMLGELRERGFRMVTIIDPGVKHESGYRVFDEGASQNLFCKVENGQLYVGMVWPGRTVFPDFSKPEARAWWGQLNAAHVESGLAGIWNDMNEPATGSISPLPMRFDRDGANHPHERFHNQYGFLMAMGTRDGLLAARPNERTFILSRAGFAGIQRVSANWMGDNASRWDHLEMSLPMANGLGLSGQPFVGADIPGFFQTPTPELMVRWMQYGVLTPFARGHNCVRFDDQYPWSFGPGVERACRDALMLRYQLLPYIYTAFVLSSETGEPIQRPLVFDFQQDRQARETDDQFLLGRGLLVAPVIQPGVVARNVYLPPGSWIDWYTRETYEGGQYRTLDAPMEHIPLLVRGGHVIAAHQDIPMSTSGLAPKVLDLFVAVPLEDGTFTSELQEDDGLTFAANSDTRLRTRFTLKRRGTEITLKAETSGSGYPEFAREKFRVVLLNVSGSSASLDGKPVALDAGTLTFDDRGQGFELAFLA
ncbi:MAG: glycoside hydrolase family 31 protein [Polyangiaceae bacterium]|nr:glycoside hydrolase family 31 protein [Polyangiaceae bacterium]